MDMRISSLDSCLRLKRQIGSKITGHIIDHYHSFLNPFIHRGLRCSTRLGDIFLSSPLTKYGIEVITHSENLTCSELVHSFTIERLFSSCLRESVHPVNVFFCVIAPVRSS